MGKKMEDVYGNELSVDRTMFVADPKQAKHLVQRKHPDCFVRLLQTSQGLATVDVYEKQGDELAIASYSAKIW